MFHRQILNVTFYKQPAMKRLSARMGNRACLCTFLSLFLDKCNGDQEIKRMYYMTASPMPLRVSFLECTVIFAVQMEA